VIDSTRLLFSLRSELDEQQFQLALLTEDKGASNEAVARQTGYVEALRDVLSSVEARAKKSDRPTFAEIEGQAV
jgi:FMN phosphatase YigB (HAD superfamily)